MQRKRRKDYIKKLVRVYNAGGRGRSTTTTSLRVVFSGGPGAWKTRHEGKYSMVQGASVYGLRRDGRGGEPGAAKEQHTTGERTKDKLKLLRSDMISE
jgi:hypothetical protein